MQSHFSESRASRREALKQMGAGFGWLALTSLLAEEAGASGPLALREPHFAPRAKRVIMLFMFGGPSHIDTFDPKPILNRDSGKPLPFAKPRIISFPRRGGDLIGSPFEFKRHGQSGAEVSELFPHVAGIVDDLAIVRSMHCTNPRHGGAVLEWHTGSDTFIRPAMGSWLTYGLGSENQNLPGYITICQALAEGGANNFGSAFLPAAHQGTPLGYGNVKANEARFPFIGDGNRTRLQRLELEMLSDVSRRQLARTGSDPELEDRIATFELAFRMQTEAPEVQDISSESAATKAMYGLDDQVTEDFGRQCLMARRFSESGVRFVQCNSNGWDHHFDLKNSLTEMCAQVDKPIAGLVKDLKARGLLDETLVIWGGEFGRTPTAENADGRDHNPHGFTMWLAGGGIKPGITYGRTDEYGYYGVENKVHFHDLHATILHLLGLDHTKLTFRHAGRDYRLTDVHGEIVRDLLA
ncbi:MAG: DUF1501 domain-containing protein [Bryobacterales bacterium]|nr:DUF1501 domain-containing protein [Bryobacterales bacterium]